MIDDGSANAVDANAVDANAVDANAVDATDSGAAAATDSRGEDVPTRRLHSFSVLLQWLSSLSRSAIPLVVLYLQHRERGGLMLPIIGGAIVALTATWSVLSYLTTRYGLSDDALIVRSGVLRRQRRIIPFGRIQTVNVQQSALQRVFGMAEVRVETGTTGRSAEAELSVLRWADAQALREQLVSERRSALGRKEAASAQAAVGAGVGAGVAAGVGTVHTANALPGEASDAGVHATSVHDSPEPELIAAISVEELMVAGGTSNNIGVLIALLISGCERFGSSFFERMTLPGDLGSPLQALTAATGSVWLFGALFLFIVVPVLFASWLVSVAGAVVRYYGFTLERVGRDLRRRHGLFSRVEASIPVARAQAIRFRQSMLRRPFKRGELILVSAGSATGSDGRAAGPQHLLPIVHVANVAAMVREVFPDADVADALDHATSSNVWKRAAAVSWLRQACASTLRISALIGVMVWWRGDAWWGLAWLLPLFWLLAGLRWRVRGLSLVPGYVMVRQGGIARTTMIMPERKLQLVEVEQGPLQRIFGVATLHLTTAGTGGEAHMIDLPLADARSVQEDLAARLPRTVRAPGSRVRRATARVAQSESRSESLHPPEWLPHAT